MKPYDLQTAANTISLNGVPVSAPDSSNDGQALIYDHTGKILKWADVAPPSNPAPYVDANSWVVYDHGSWKEYVQRWHVSVPNGSSNWVCQSVTLPVGVSTMADVWSLVDVMSEGGYGYELSAHIESYASTNTTLSISAGNRSGSTCTIAVTCRLWDRA